MLIDYNQLPTQHQERRSMSIIEEIVMEKMIPELIKRIKEFMYEDLYEKDEKVNRLAEICSIIVWEVLGPEVFKNFNQSGKVIRDFCHQFASNIDDYLIEDDRKKQKDCK